MTSPEQADLSRLRIDREAGSPRRDPPRSPLRLALYFGGVVALALAAFFFFRTIGPAEVVELATVGYVSPSQASSLLTASGYVVAQRKASIASKATGRIVYLGFHEGDKVKKGDIIARIESEDVEASLAQASADLEGTKADRNDAERTLARAKKLFDSRLVSQADLDGASARYDRVVAAIASKEAAVRAAQVQLENTRIRAPFDGTILTKNADIGEVVAPFAAGASSRVAVVTLADMSSLQVEADVSESNIERIKLDQPCEIVLDAYPEQRYSGRVDRIVPTADRAKATVLTKVRFDDRDTRVLPEMSAKVHFLSKELAEKVNAPPKLAVNSNAITTHHQKKIVFVCRDDIISEVPVEVGGSIGSMVEILSGLSAGDKVVVKPSEGLRSGMKVNVKK
ncbi:MAG TPA: efflux RND transporter periplasmic adaptor subunit [Bacteroidota bacterium]|nr:efflux RND transporter periplasmic adaptor subunit [Bacteroidota bacterium]